MTSHVADTRPYPWPYDGRLDGARLALVAAGWDDGWQSRVADPDAACDAVHRLADAVTRRGGELFSVAHAGAQALELPGARVATAIGIDGTYGSPLEPWLRGAGRSHVLLVGHGLEGPVHSTLRALNDRGYECLLVADACSPIEPDLVAAAIGTVTMSGGIFGAVGTTDPTVAALAASTSLDPSPPQEP